MYSVDETQTRVGAVNVSLLDKELPELGRFMGEVTPFVEELEDGRFNSRSSGFAARAINGNVLISGNGINGPIRSLLVVDLNRSTTRTIIIGKRSYRPSIELSPQLT